MIDLETFVKNHEGESRVLAEELVHTIVQKNDENKILQQEIDYLKHQNRLLRKKLFGTGSEKLSDTAVAHQTDLQLFNEFELAAQELSKAETPEPDQTSSVDLNISVSPTHKPGRKKLPPQLPRVIIEHDLSAEEKQCPCGAEMACIGTQTSEELDYVPAQLRVMEHHCKKYICEACAKAKEEHPETAVTNRMAKKPASIIEKSFASAGLLAQIVVSKFCDHLPLYRQEQIFRRLLLDLSRQTMSGWMLQLGEAIIPLINLMQEEILNYDVAFSDETTVQVLHEPGRRAQTKSFMWCFLGGTPEKFVAIYQYHPSRAGEVAEKFFAGYRGGLHCDGYGGYRGLLKSPEIIGLNCMAHVRRKFIEALPNGEEKGVSGVVVQKIRELYHIEEQLKRRLANPGQIKETRQRLSKPILESLKSYLDEKARISLPQGALGKAITYARQRWSYLITYLEDGRYEIDNNRTERAIKPFVCGRNNWLFSNSVEGAHASARLYSLIETAKMHQLNPAAYLKYVFTELPNCKTVEDYEALLPYNIKDKNLKTST